MGCKDYELGCLGVYSAFPGRRGHAANQHPVHVFSVWRNVWADCRVVLRRNWCSYFNRERRGVLCGSLFLLRRNPSRPVLSHLSLAERVFSSQQIFEKKIDRRSCNWLSLSGSLSKSSGAVFLFLTPQGLNIPAQGKALGIWCHKVFSPERALHIFGLLWLTQKF